MEETFRREINGLTNELSSYTFNNDFFAKFWEKAFPDNKDMGYVQEWVERFMRGTPSTYMDKVRTKAYIETILEWNGMTLEDLKDGIRNNRH